MLRSYDGGEVDSSGGSDIAKISNNIATKTKKFATTHSIKSKQPRPKVCRCTCIVSAYLHIYIYIYIYIYGCACIRGVYLPFVKKVWV